MPKPKVTKPIEPQQPTQKTPAIPAESSPSPQLSLNLLKPSGTNDFLPEDMDKRRWLTRVIEDLFQLYGFQQIDIPLYDFFQLYKVRSGEKIINDIFTFTDPPSHLAKVDPPLYALRPEFTAPLVRSYITTELMYRPKPQKYFYIGSCFRYEEPQKGRYRQFTQAGVEIFGADSPAADAEVLIIAMDLMKRLGIRNYLLRINDLTILRSIFEETGIPPEKYNKIFGIIDKVTAWLRKLEIGALPDRTQADIIDDYYGLMNDLEIERDHIELLENLLLCVGKPQEIMPRLTQIFHQYPKTCEVIANSKIGQVTALIETVGVTNFVIDAGIARGLDYYTNIVFEIDVPSLGSEKQVCGGGRYNNLIREFGGEETPALGFSFGFDRLIIALENQGDILPLPYRSDVFLAVKPETQAYGFNLAQKLRIAGLRVEIDLMDRTFKTVGKFVNRLNIPFMIFLGPQELASGKITLKDFTTEEQYENLTVEDAIQRIQAKIINKRT